MYDSITAMLAAYLSMYVAQFSVSHSLHPLYLLSLPYSTSETVRCFACVSVYMVPQEEAHPWSNPLCVCQVGVHYGLKCRARIPPILPIPPSYIRPWSKGEAENLRNIPHQTNKANRRLYFYSKYST